LLTNYADQLIVPAFGLVNRSVDSLDQKALAFFVQKDTQKLVEFQNAFKNAYLNYQRVAFFNFGPSLDDNKISINIHLNTFPVNSSKLESYIKSNNTSFANFDRNTRGFPALDYLLFDTTAQNAHVIALFTNSDSTFRKNYTLAVIQDIKTRVSQTLQSWTTYRNDFISNNGTDAGSSVNFLFNALLEGYETSKNFRMALPMGKRAGQTNSLPLHVEAYSSALSGKLLSFNMLIAQQMWAGIGLNGVDGLGFDDYLNNSNGSSLVADTKAQFAAIHLSLDAWKNESFASLIRSNDVRISNSITEMQKLTRFIKSELQSLLGLTITYSSGDGD
jgi:predicted lipoprotein